MSGARDQVFMRGLLASVGIVLKDPTPEIAPTVATPQVEVDRDEIRALLVARGAPASSIDWLTASCPSAEYACEYVPPQPIGSVSLLEDFNTREESDDDSR